MIEDEPAEKDRFALADTRPGLWLFIPYEIAIWYGMGFFMFNIAFHSWKAGFLMIPIWILTALLVRRDVNGVRVAMVRSRTMLLLFDQHRWGGLSASPWALKAKADRYAA